MTSQPIRAALVVIVTVALAVQLVPGIWALGIGVVGTVRGLF